jgi:hypothetical protein
VYKQSGWLPAVKAVTVIVKGVPAVTLEGAVTWKCVAAFLLPRSTVAVF